jgi:hypothetical protein
MSKAEKDEEYKKKLNQLFENEEQEQNILH